MGNYDANEPTNAQLESLNSLVRELTKKYGIDLGEKTFPSHKACTASDNCPEWHVIKTTYEYPIIWHLDVWHTTCPWEHLYEAIEDIRLQNLEYTKWFTPIWYSETQESIEERYGQILEILRWSSHKKRILLLIAINQRLKTETNPTYIWKMKKIRSLIFQVLREK